MLGRDLPTPAYVIRKGGGRGRVRRAPVFHMKSKSYKYLRKFINEQDHHADPGDISGLLGVIANKEKDRYSTFLPRQNFVKCACTSILVYLRRLPFLPFFYLRDCPSSPLLTFPLCPKRVLCTKGTTEGK